MMIGLLVQERLSRNLLFGLLLAGPLALSAQASCLSGLDLLAALPHTAAFDQGTVKAPDLVRLAPAYGTEQVSGWPAGVGVMAFARRADGAVMLVPDRAFRLDGNQYRRGQLLEVIDGQIAAISWLGEARVVRAVDYHVNRYFFVQEDYRDIEGIAQVGPRTVMFNVLDANGNPVGAINSHEVGQPGDLPRNVRINALAVIDSDHWLLVFDRGVTIQGEYYARADVVLYRVQSRTFERALRLSDVDARWETLAPVDISLRERIDQIFRDRFQPAAGLAQRGEGVGSC
jgi:hypothetical protein